MSSTSVPAPTGNSPGAAARSWYAGFVLAVFAAFSPSTGAADNAGEFPTHLTIREGWYPQLVTIDFVRRHVSMPPRDDVVIVDTRDTARRYAAGHIPGALSIPAHHFDDLAPALLPADKGRLLLLYCDGVDCKLSHLAALDAEDLGHTNIKVYVEGFPDWFKRGEVYAISAAYLQKSRGEERPPTLFDVRSGSATEGIPGARLLPGEHFSELTAGLLPEDKTVPLVFYCDQPQQALSYAAARRAHDLGYRNVAILAGGLAAWQALTRQ